MSFSKSKVIVFALSFLAFESLTFARTHAATARSGGQTLQPNPDYRSNVKVVTSGKNDQRVTKVQKSAVEMKADAKTLSEIVDAGTNGSFQFQDRR